MPATQKATTLVKPVLMCMHCTYRHTGLIVPPICTKAYHQILRILIKPGPFLCHATLILHIVTWQREGQDWSSEFYVKRPVARTYASTSDVTDRTRTLISTGPLQILTSVAVPYSFFLERETNVYAEHEIVCLIFRMLRHTSEVRKEIIFKNRCKTMEWNSN